MKKCKYCKAREVSKTRKNCKFCSIECTQKYFKKYKISAFYNPKLHSYIARLGGKSTQRLYPNLSSNNGKRAQITLKRLGKGMYNKKNPLGKLGGKIGGKKGAETNKKNKTGCCYHPKWRGVGGKIGGVVSHIRHPNLARENGKRTLKILRKLKIGACHDPKWKGAGGRVGGKAVQKLLKEKQISAFYNPKIQREIRLNIYNNRHSFYFKKIYYDSNMEREIAMNIHYQLERLVLWKNYQVIINRKFIDFLIEKYRCFIEFHPIRSNENYNRYYNKRRDVLNKGGYKDYNLIIIS